MAAVARKVGINIALKKKSSKSFSSGFLLTQLSTLKFTLSSYHLFKTSYLIIYSLITLVAFVCLFILFYFFYLSPSLLLSRGGHKKRQRDHNLFF